MAPSLSGPGTDADAAAPVMFRPPLTGPRVVATLAIPALVYPLLVALLFAQDFLFGDRTFLHLAIHESRRELAGTLLADGIHALPWLYGLTLPTWYAARWVLRRIGAHRPALVGLAGAVAGALPATLLADALLAPPVLSFAIAGAIALLALEFAAAMPRGGDRT